MKLLRVPEVYIGENALNEIENVLKKLNAQKIMVVTDKGIVKAGIYAKLEKILKDLKKEIVLFDEVLPDPEIRLVSDVAQIARKEKIDVVIGLGGGSSIDTAKVAAALVTNDKDVNSYIGIGLLEKDSVPIIAIPTTAGTGSEVTAIAILSDNEEQLKKAIVSEKIIPQYAILDPILTIGLPPHITAATGMDALTHAIEAFTSKNANDYTDSMAKTAIKLISKNIRIAYNEPGNIKAREKMLLGSLMAGIAFANAGVTAVHAFAYPLGGMFHVPHGLANSLMLPTILEYNMVGSEEKFKQVGLAFGRDNVTAKTVVDEVNSLCKDLNIPKNLAEINIPKDAIEKMAEGAMKGTRLLANNPREITIKDAVEIYLSAYSK